MDKDSQEKLLPPVKEHKPKINQFGRKSKPKEDSDDTTQYSGDSSNESEDVYYAREARRSRRKSYKTFRREYKGFWMWFNLLTAFFSAGFMVGTYLVLD